MIGSQMTSNSKKRISNVIENYNYLTAKDRLAGPYLRMDVHANLIGEKIDIYDGPNLLDRARIRTLMENRPDTYQDYQKALNRQKVSFGLDLARLASNLVFIVYIISPQFQSSTPSNLIMPLVFTDLALGLASVQFRRRARNLTRHALDRYNFGEPDPVSGRFGYDFP